jgi:hypothetical protein
MDVGGGPNGFVVGELVGSFLCTRSPLLDVLPNTGFNPMASAIRPTPRNIQVFLPKPFMGPPIEQAPRAWFAAQSDYFSRYPATRRF